jgi:uncharacterized membrane protein YgdD (TMEM256/DUF423 family)
MENVSSPIMCRWLLVLASILGASGVGVGAYAAHGLQASLEKQQLSATDIAKRVDQAETGVRYHIAHTLAMLTLAVTGYVNRSRLAMASVVCMIVGIGLFSGVLYAIAMAASTLHWLVPIGGLAFMVGWILLAVSAITYRQPAA